MRTSHILWGVSMLCVVSVCAVHVWREQCVVVEPIASVMSSHGWGTWSGETFMSLVHHDARICIPEGWEAVGATRTTHTWAQFPSGQGAIFIRPEAFDSFDLHFEKSAYHVRVLYPRSLPEDAREVHRADIVNAFERVGSLYPNDIEPREHTVLITVGLAGAGDDFYTSVYPEPGPTLSTVARTHEHPRSEELLIHAVAHLYNRHRPDLTMYQQSQGSVPAGDFQELEATWVEVFARRSESGRRARLDALYATHEAVYSGVFVPDLLYPFVAQEAFDAIQYTTVVLPVDAAYSDYQYGHYILAPLVMVAVDGLLREQGAPYALADLMVHTHEQRTGLMNELRNSVSEEDIERIDRWMKGEELIPHHLIESGRAQYELVQ